MGAGGGGWAEARCWHGAARVCVLVESWRCWSGWIKRRRREVWVGGVEEAWDQIWKEKRWVFGGVAEPGPTSTCTDTRSSAVQTRKQPPWLNAGAANQRLGSRRWWDERANESASGCGESDWQRSRVKLISCTAPISSPLPPSQTFRFFTQNSRKNFTFSQLSDIRAEMN